MTQRPSIDELTSLLRGVVDPELGGDIVELGMVGHVEIDEDGAVDLGIILTISGCPLRAQIRDDAKRRLLAHPGVTSVSISWGEMTAEQRTEVMQRARRRAADNAPDTAVPATARVLAVASGKGGVGKSSVTTNLAVALARRGFVVGVLDADIWGFSIPRMLGVDGRLEAEEGKIVPITRPVEAGRIELVSMGLLVDAEDTAIMWRGLMLTKAVEQFLRDVAWPTDLDYLLIDMPPGTGDVQMGLARLLPRADVLIVTTPALSAQKVAVRVADMARRTYLRVAGVIENMSSFEGRDGEVYHLFGRGGGERLAADVGAPLIGTIPLEEAMAAGADDGRPVAAGTGPAAAAFADIAARIVDDVAPPVEMSGCTARVLDAVEEALGPAE